MVFSICEDIASCLFGVIGLANILKLSQCLNNIIRGCSNISITIWRFGWNIYYKK
jgi:hypothetical protein